MKILCDTSSVILLIRIAPNMFINDKFNCFTVREVWEEIFQTQRFKSKYSWRDNFKNKIKTASSYDIKDSFREKLEIIQNMIETGITNKKNNRFFDLSLNDKKIIAYALAFGSKLSANDSDMKDFFEQQFEERCLSSLALLNEWIENELIIWDENLQQTIKDWDINEEPVQPMEDVRKFERFTGKQYLGPK